ncbi:hypothetical protein CEXT_654461 [Caerostris extrusa]|uniref:Maturase K n=1 Tax=Caerostris extrusa TaxID=172846 RepID=A0AAV4TT17_CAEEX|nr:hypothetical protein CEXT_654461 [Caerostris extrusa]
MAKKKQHVFPLYRNVIYIFYHRCLAKEHIKRRDLNPGLFIRILFPAFEFYESINPERLRFLSGISDKTDYLFRERKDPNKRENLEINELCFSEAGALCV